MNLACLLLFLAADAVAQTHVGVTVNQGATRVALGAPLLVVATAVGSPGATGGVEVQLTSEDGQPIVLTPRPARAEVAAMDELEVATSLWTLSPEASGALRPGRYFVQAKLGQRTSPAVAIQIDLAAAPDALALSHWDEIEGRPEAALARVNAVLAAEPESVVALVRKSELLAAQGQAREALRALDQAIDLLRRDGGEEADGLMELHPRRQQLLRQVLKKAPSARDGAWSR